MKNGTLLVLPIALSVVLPLSCGSDSSSPVGQGGSAAAGGDASVEADSPDALTPDGTTPPDAKSDAPGCGDGVVAPGETCDGNCPTSCDDGDGCTQDVLTGSALLCNVTCQNTVTITSCTSGDDCCPAGCDRNTDSDCPYHVDSTTGNDANDGLTPQTAWKTVAKVNATSFVPGDNIAFKRGEVWHEALLIKSKGDKSKPIVFRSYGAGADKPVLSPTRAITQWTAAQNSIYVADLDVETNQVMVDGQRLAIAHHPNTGYLYVDTEEDSSNKTSFDDADLAVSKADLVGSEINIRSVRWAYDPAKVVDLVGQRVTIDPGIEDAGVFHKNTGYILANKLWMLDAPGEWFYDKDMKKLYLRTLDDSPPSSHNVEVSVAEAAIEVQYPQGVVVNGLEVRHASRYGIRLTGPTYAQVKNCVSIGSGAEGIIVDWPSAGGVIDVLDNIVRKSAYTGISVSADPAISQKTTVQRNQVFDTMPGFPLVGRTQSYPGGIAIMVHGAGVEVKSNIIKSSGYSCSTYGGTSHLIEQNVIEQCCLLLDDCGGIYMGGDSHVVRSNIVRDSIGNSEGDPSFFKDKGTAAQGIYADDRSHGILIEGNTVVNADLGYQIHNSYSNQIKGNTSYASRETAIWFSEDTIVNIVGYVHDNVTEDSIYFPNPEALALGEGGWLGSITFGSFDRNRYWHSKGKLPIRQSLQVNGEYQSRDYALQDWRDATGYDLNSKDITEAYRVEPIVGKPTGAADLISNGTFDAATTGWAGWPAAVSVTWAADCGLTGGCLRFVANPPSDGALLSSNSFAVTAGTGYQVKFSALASAPDTLTAVVRRGSDPWDDVGLVASASVNGARTDFTFVFVATKSATARLDFGFSKSGTQFSLDDVSVREVTVSHNDPADDSRIIVNPTAADATTDLQGVQYCDVDGATVSGQVVLKPYTSMILLSCFCNNDYQCNNKETAATCPQDCP
ncbi:MAG: right-handed parallel beta-helix repeat-containing protein [Deltaproteobacteria bacterium]|nr:right-handed parallel beta-helix repeat-containing protein [Deltaproteobacteria bacterium]